MIKLPNMVVNENNTVSAAVSFALGGAVATCLLSVFSVITSALAGWLIEWCFSGTFAAFMAKVGLAEFALWQLTAVMTFIALNVRPFYK